MKSFIYTTEVTSCDHCPHVEYLDHDRFVPRCGKFMSSVEAAELGFWSAAEIAEALYYQSSIELTDSCPGLGSC